jgi:hypothetical protein
MWHRIKDLWTHNRYLLIAFVVAISLSGFFSARAVSQFVYWADPAHQDQTLAGWMTPRYVGRSYDITPEVVQEAFNLLQDGAPRRVSLEKLSEEKGISLNEMQWQLDVVVARWRAEQGLVGE